MRLIAPLPKDILVCCSGGVDSIAVTHRLIHNGYNVSIYHFNHGTPTAPEMEEAVRRFAKHFQVDCIVHQTDKPLSGEADFREARIKFLQDGNFNAVTAHHLDDAVEQYCLNFLSGTIRKIPMNIVSAIGGSKVYHPFLTNTKDELIKYANKKRLMEFVVEDPTNHDPTYGRRNWIRNELLPQLTKKQIGLRTIVRKQYLSYIDDNN